jgi:hypothetical protein
MAQNKNDMNESEKKRSRNTVSRDELIQVLHTPYPADGDATSKGAWFSTITNAMVKANQLIGNVQPLVNAVKHAEKTIGENMK